MDEYADLTLEALKALATEKRGAITALFALDAPTDEQVTKAEALGAEIDAIRAEVSRRETAAADKAKKFADLRARFGKEGEDDGSEISVSGEEEQDKDVEPESDVPEEEPANPAEAEAGEGDSGGDSGSAASRTTTARGSVQRLASRTNRPDTPVKHGSGPAVIIASADVPEVPAGQKLTPDGLTKAIINRTRGFTPPQGDDDPDHVELHKFGVASIRLDFPEELTIDRGTDDMEVLYRAGDETRLPGDSLVAAGGWCAPSETLYDLAADESLEGILSLPEVNVKRGGIRYTTGPQFADFYTNAGFIQTEAQAIAGTTKPCYEVTCPAFVEVRLDAVGVCIKVPILTNAAYPELVQRFQSGTMIAHQHMLNANVINRMLALTPAARVITGLGSTVSDTMEGLELLADQRRQKYRLPLARSLEVVVPFWVKGAMRSDLARRQGVAAESITDAQIAAQFSARNVKVSYVYDWQVLDDTAEVYPATFNALMYPAGTFVKGVNDVINVSAVYDAASLAVNTYTGLFMESGLLVAKKQYDADLITFPVCNSGAVGAAEFSCSTP